MHLLLKPLDRRLSVEAGANLLGALQQGQVPISYSCMAGRCGTCQCRVLEGDVETTDGQRRQSIDKEPLTVLACQTRLLSACTIELPDSADVVVHPARVFKATVAGLESLTHDIRRLLLRPSKPLAFSPGQCVQIQFAPDHVRPYSMAGLPGDELLEFHVRVVPNGRVSGYIDRQLRVGDPVKVSGPLGSAYLRHASTSPLLCVAGGTGLAPVLSILRGAVALAMPNPIHVYFGVRSPEDTYGMAWLEAIKKGHPRLTLHTVVANDGHASKHRVGHVTDAVAADHLDLGGWRAYFCGSPPMVEAATAVARHRGINPQHIYADAFYAQSS